MRKLMVTAGAAALLLASSLAAIAEEATGAIASLDTSARTVTLDNGQTFMLPSEMDGSSLQIGQRVTVSYEEGANGSDIATAVTPVEQ